ncbi:MAG: GNAT family N-acetyltransferase [Ornithinimicrobium sp.]
MVVVSVIRANASHALVVASMLATFNAEFDTPSPPLEVLQRRLVQMLERDDVLVLVASSSGAASDIESDAAVGFALVTLRPTPYYDGPLAVLDELYVVPRLRALGHGTTMMLAMFDELRRQDCGEVHINVDEQDGDTRRFYEAHGFTNRQPGADERMLCYIQEL